MQIKLMFYNPFKRSKKMEAKQILEQSIKDHQKAIDEAKSKLDGLEVTYSIGDRFKKKGRKFMLVSQHAMGVGMAALDDGCLQYGTTKVQNRNIMTDDEVDGCCQLGLYTRYWDSQKEVLV